MVSRATPASRNHTDRSRTPACRVGRRRNRVAKVPMLTGWHRQQAQRARFYGAWANICLKFRNKARTLTAVLHWAPAWRVISTRLLLTFTPSPRNRARCSSPDGVPSARLSLPPAASTRCQGRRVSAGNCPRVRPTSAPHGQAQPVRPVGHSSRPCRVALGPVLNTAPFVGPRPNRGRAHIHQTSRPPWAADETGPVVW